MTFEHLFLVGMNQDAYPRTGREDPLLPDVVRRPLRERLPGLALHAMRRDEERFLFAELLSSAAHVTLSWQRSDEDGKLRAPSPFLQRLLLRDGEEARIARPVGRRLRELAESGRPLTAREHLLRAALEGDRDAWTARLEAVFEERGIVRPAQLALSRRRILEEFDPDRRTSSGRLVSASPGPYLGFLGKPERDPREMTYVTHLEAYARCPWQSFLTRTMRLEAPLDPLESLPAIDGRMLGILVHDALQALVEDGTRRGSSLSTLKNQGTRTVPPPDPARIDALLVSLGEKVARDHGLYLPGLQKVLARRARPFVDVAVQIDWPNPASAIELLGCEVQSSIALPDHDGEPRTIAYRIDRVDRPGGKFVLTDYKTGRPHSTSASPQRVQEDFQDQFEQGLRLQIVVYAATELDGSPCRARYLYLRPDNQRFEYGVSSRDDIVTKDLPRVVARLLRGRDRGVSFPRLEGPNGAEPRTCEWCEVSLACVRSDSGQRARLRRIAERVRASGGEGEDTLEATFLPLWDHKREATRGSRAAEGAE